MESILSFFPSWAFSAIIVLLIIIIIIALLVFLGLSGALIYRTLRFGVKVNIKGTEIDATDDTEAKK
jgi:lipopolysaccharide/colanic/teichoic acid biosynthesis glycosyltransferase